MSTGVKTLSPIIVLALIFAISCSSGGNGNGNPLSPNNSAGTDKGSAIETTSNRMSSANDSSHNLWGYFQVSVDPDKLTAAIVPVRVTSEHWNILKFLEQSPCTNCVKIASLGLTDQDTLTIGLQITHPFPTSMLTGFDVRGIMMFTGSKTFPESELTYSDRTTGDGKLLNADGYTTLYNPSTAGSGPGGYQGYMEGHFTGTIAPDAKLNGFKRYVSPGDNPRNMFNSGESITVTFEIDPPDGAFAFGYAVDANWVKPVGDVFPPNANCPEPWKVLVNLDSVGEGLNEKGGVGNGVQLAIDVYDHQGKESYTSPTIECPEIFDGPLTASWEQDGSDYSRYLVTVENSKLVGPGDYKCLVKIVDNQNDPIKKPWLDLSSYQICTLTVEHKKYGWARTWGGDSDDSSYGVAVDSSGYVYVTGFFKSAVDFDPDKDVEAWEYTSGDTSDTDAFLCKYDQNGGLVDFSQEPDHTVLTWGGAFPDEGRDVTVDSEGNVYVTGIFRGTVDFDPGKDPDEKEIYTSSGGSDIFLSKFGPNGDFHWACAWGGTAVSDDESHRVLFHGNGVYVTGNMRESGLNAEAFLYTVDPGNGSITKTSTWGGTDDDDAWGMAWDASNNMYVTGRCGNNVDFEPGPGQCVWPEPLGNWDIYLSKFDSDGILICQDGSWPKRWGSEGFDAGYDVAIDGEGFPLVTGEKNGQAFLCRIDPDSAEFTCGSKDWGCGNSGHNERGVRVHYSASTGNIIVSGNYDDYQVKTDFDPGPGTDYHTGYGMFLVAYEPDGIDLIYQKEWTKVLDGDDWLYSTALNDSYGLFVAGKFGSTCDFDACAGTDNHLSIGAYDAFVMKFPITGDGCW